MAMPGGSIGTIYVDLDLNPERFVKSQAALYKDATTTTLNIEANFKKMGIHSAAEMDLMRAKVTNAFNMIAHSSQATANDIIRAEEAKNAKLNQLAEMQHGHQIKLLDGIRESYKELGIRSSADMEQMRENIVNAYNMIANSSKSTAEDIVRAEEAKNAKLKELNEQQFGHQKTLAESVAESFKTLGVTTAAEYDKMRSDAVAAYDLIANSGLKSSADVTKAKEAEVARIDQLNEQQYGHQKTLAESVAESFKTLGVTTAAEYDKMRTSIIADYDMIANAAKTSTAVTAEDVVKAEEAKVAKLKALAEEQFGHQKTLLDALKEHWIGVTAGIYAVYKIADKVYETAKEWSKLAIAQDLTDRALKAVMVTNSRYSEQFYQGTIKQAQALARLTGFTDQSIETAQKFLMTMRGVTNDVLPRATLAVVNLAAMMGHGEGGLQMAAMAVERAMQGATEGIRRHGIVIDTNVYKQRGAIGVLEEIERRINGQAEAIAQGSGQWKIFGMQISEAKEGIGKFLNTIAERTGAIESLVWWIDKLNIGIKKLNDATKEGVGFSEKLKDLNEWRSWAKNKAESGSGPIQSFFSDPLGFMADPLGKSLNDQRLIDKRLDGIESYYKKKVAEILRKTAGQPPGQPSGQPSFLDQLINRESELQIESMQKIMDAAGLSSKVVDDLTDKEKAFADAMKTVNDIIAQNTLTTYQLEVYELDKKFAGLRETLGDIPALMEAQRLALEALREKYGQFGRELSGIQWGLLQQGPLATPGGSDIFKGSGFLGQPSTSGWGNLGFGGFSTFLTPSPSLEQLDAEMQALVNRDLAAYEKAQAKIKENEDKIKRQQDEIMERWESLVNQMGDSFTNTLVDSIMGDKDAWKNLGKSILDQILSGWVNRLITQQFITPLINSMSGLFAQSAGNTASGGMPSWMNYLWQSPGEKTSVSDGRVINPYVGYDLPFMAGAGILGYQSGGALGSFGSMAGGAMGGPIGAVIGGYLGSLVNKAKDAEPELPSLNLLWEVIDGKIKLVSETWDNMAKDSSVYQAAEEFLQTQVDFFKKLSMITGGEEVPFSFNIKGSGFDMESILNQSTGQEMMKAALGSSGGLSEVFGTKFSNDLKDLFVEVMTKNQGMFTFGNNEILMKEYFGWKFNQLSAMSPEKAQSEFKSMMSGPSIFSPVGRPGIRATSILDLFQARFPGRGANEKTFGQLEQFAKSVSPGWFDQGEITFVTQGAQDQIKEFFTDAQTQINELFDFVTSGLGGAILSSLDTGEFQTFEQSFKKSILAGVQQGLIQGFAEQELMPLIFKPFYGNDERPALTEVLKQYQSGDVDLKTAMGYLTSMAGDVNTTMAGLEPVWDLLNKTNNAIVQALGINTTATQSNTDAVLGPVQSFLMSLDTGPLAPSQSIAGLMDWENKLYTAAFADPTKFGDYASFMTSSYLPDMQGVSPDYEGLVSGVESKVGAIPWYMQAQNEAATPATATATDIGTEVGNALKPQTLGIVEKLDDLGDDIKRGWANGWEAFASFVTSGVKKQVVASLDDPNVIAKIRSRVS